MVKSELIRVLSKKLPELEATDVELAVNCLLEQMMTAIESGEHIEARGFGSFDLRHQPASKDGGICFNTRQGIDTGSIKDT